MINKLYMVYLRSEDDVIQLRNTMLNKVVDATFIEDPSNKTLPGHFGLIWEENIRAYTLKQVDAA